VEELDMSIFGGLVIIVILVIIAVLLRQGRTNKKREQEKWNLLCCMRLCDAKRCTFDSAFSKPGVAEVGSIYAFPGASIVG
jgi:hypothetical protein